MTLKFRWETEFKETEEGIKIPKDWKERKIKNVGDVAGGTTPSTKNKDYWNGNIPWITPNDLTNYEYIYIQQGERNITEEAVKKCSLKVFPKGTVLLTTRAPVGYVAIADNPVTTNQGFRNIIPREETNSEFLLYYLKAEVINEYLKDIAGGSTFQELTGSTLKQVVCPYPEKSEQFRIATVLTGFDELIENKKRQNEIFEASADAIFRSWFTRFDLFKKAEFKESELGEIPKKWNLKPIGELAKLRNGISYSGKEKFDEKVEGSKVFITLNNAIEGGGFKPVYAWIKSDRIKEHQLLEEGDLILPNTEQTKDERLLGSPGIVFFPYDYKGEKGVFSHHITKVNVHNWRYKLYLYCFLKVTREDSASFHTGTGVLGLDLKNFRKNKMVLDPGDEILEEFHSSVEPLFNKIILNQKRIMLLRKIRDTLLPLLVFGKLRLEEI